MATVNLFTANLEGRALRSEISATNKAVRAALANYVAALDAEFTKVIKDTDRRARNVANAAKGRYHSAAAVVAACYPYQTADGVLLTRVKSDSGKVWAAKKLTATAARGIVRDSLKNFTRTVGAPVIEVHEIDAEA